MVFRENWKPFISGEQFSSSGVFTLNTKKGKSKDRIDLLCQMSLNRKVIHLGCADHVGLIQEKISRSRWLQERLSMVSEKCIGFDNNEKSIEYIRRELRRDDCIFFDMENDEIPKEVKGETWDVLILGEMLEHVDNPVLFLKLLSKRFRGVANEIIVTVPNCFSWENMPFSFRDKEFINTDHRYWFSPYTIAKVGARAGLEISKIQMCGSTEGRSLIYSLLTNRTPMLRETIIATFGIVK